MSDFISSLRSLYHLIKTRQAPYFYICAHSMTILIRSSGVGGINEVHVLITPTTSGFREALKREGISFVLPFMDKKYDATSNTESTIGSNSVTSGLIDESSRASIVSNVDADKENDTNAINEDPDNEDNDLMIDEDEEPTSFLESLGLSQQDFPSLSNRPKSGRSHMKHDAKGDSSKMLSAKQVKKRTLVLITGSDVQLFINYLSNDQKLICTTSGPMASVPATLLAPVCFNGASLVPLKLKLNQSTYQDKKFFSLDIVGPILPSSVINLSDFFKSTQGGDYKMNLITSESTLLLQVLIRLAKSGQVTSFLEGNGHHLKETPNQRSLLPSPRNH